MKLSLSFLGKFDFLGLLLLRLGVGGVLCFHGFPLLTAGASIWKQIGTPMQLLQVSSGHAVWGLISVMIQVFGGLAIVIGLFTRASALLAAIVIGFSLGQFIAQGQPWLETLVVAQLCLACLSLVFTGPGRLSIDRRGI